MSKLFIALSSFVLAVSAFAGAPKGKAPEVGTTHNELATMMEKFIDANKQYTKKSRIYFNDDALEKAISYLHASNVAVDRTTYYDEDYNDGGALLMGDYNGGFTINSGYATNASGKLDHYRGTSVADEDEKLFSERNVDYTVNSTCNEYFDVLGGLIAQVRAGSASDWTYADGVYTHTTPATITLDAHGNYNDILLKKFQYFGAPMLLQRAGASASNFLTFSSIKIENKSDYLSIKLMLSSGNQGLTTTPVENGEVMLSEARVYKGLSFFAPYHATINGKFVEAKDIKTTNENLAEFEFDLDKDDELNMYRGTNALHFYHWSDADIDDGDTYVPSRDGRYKFYFNTREKMYSSITQLDVMFIINYDTHNNGGIYIVHMDGNWSGSLDYRMTWNDGNDWTIKLRLVVGQTYVYKFARGNWDDAVLWKDGWEADPNRTLLVTSETPETLRCNWQA